MYFFNISLVLDGKTTLGLPNSTPFSFAILIPSACLCFILLARWKNPFKEYILELAPTKKELGYSWYKAIGGTKS